MPNAGKLNAGGIARVKRTDFKKPGSGRLDCPRCGQVETIREHDDSGVILRSGRDPKCELTVADWHVGPAECFNLFGASEPCQSGPSRVRSE
jgi:hypothetical protein